MWRLVESHRVEWWLWCCGVKWEEMLGRASPLILPTDLSRCLGVASDCCGARSSQGWDFCFPSQWPVLFEAGSEWQRPHQKELATWPTPTPGFSCGHSAVIHQSSLMCARWLVTSFQFLLLNLRYVLCIYKSCHLIKQRMQYWGAGSKSKMGLGQ